MPKGRRLTNIASGMCCSFASRNNDLDGYWSIGKLRSLAERYGQTTVSLDLLMSSIRNRFLSGVVSFDFSSRHNPLRVQRHGAGHGKAGISYLEGSRMA